MSKRKKPKVTPLRYFFYHGDLCKKLHIHRPDDIITVWNYPKGKLEKHVYSDVRRNGEQAFSTPQVQKLVGRGRLTLMKAISTGAIHRPQATYGLDENRNVYKYYWSAKNIFELHEYLKTIHHGAPRMDGMVTPLPMPSTAELRAALRQGTVFYVKEGDKFVPTWQADKL